MPRPSNFERNEARRAAIATLVEYLGAREDGETITWLRIEADTEIKMNANGRELVRKALKKLKRPYVTLHGDGVRLSAPDNAIAIVHKHARRVVNSAKKTDRVRQQCADRHLEAMAPSDRRTMVDLAALAGAVKSAARNASEHAFERLKTHASRVFMRRDRKLPEGL